MDPTLVFLTNLIIWILVVGLLVYLVRWALTYMEVPDPARKVVMVIVAIVVLIAALRILIGVGGQPIHLLG